MHGDCRLGPFLLRARMGWILVKCRILGPVGRFSKPATNLDLHGSRVAT